MPRRARGMTALLAAIAAALAIGVQTVSAVVLWTMTATPLTAVVGVNTTFTFTATNLDPLLGIKCVIVEIPTAINPGEVWIAGSSTTAAWTASRSGQQVTAMIASGDGDEKLRVGDWLSFVVAGVPRQAGVYAVPAVAYSGHDCVNGARALAAPPLIVISEPLLSEPTPAPTPTPTPTPTPIITLPSIVPTLPPLLPTPRPVLPPTTVTTPAPLPTSAPLVSPKPGPSRTASPSTAASESAAVTGVPAGPRDGGLAGSETPSDSSRGAALAVARPEEAGDEPGVSLGPLGVIDGLSVWAIPGAVVGGPGLLVILWVAVQAGVAAAWIPAVRRMRGDGRRARLRASTATDAAATRM